MTNETSVTEIMSTPVERIDSDEPIAAAARRLIEKGIGSLIVGEREIEGIVTESDVVASVGEEVDPTTPVSALLSEPVETIESDATVSDAGARMGKHGVKRLPVTEDGEPVGIVTTTDLARFLSTR